MPYINTIDINGEVYHVANLTDGEHIVDLPSLNNDDMFLLRGSIVDSLTSTLTDKPLSAKQGKILNEKIDTTITTFQNTVDNISGRILSIACGSSTDGIVYTATGDDLPTVSAANSDEQISAVGKGRQIVFVPYTENTSSAPTLQINGGEIIPIRLRAPKKQSSNEQSPDATLPVWSGALMRGVPYTMTFCGKYWLVDSMPYSGRVDITKEYAAWTPDDGTAKTVANYAKTLTDGCYYIASENNGFEHVEIEIFTVYGYQQWRIIRQYDDEFFWFTVYCGEYVAMYFDGETAELKVNDWTMMTDYNIPLPAEEDTGKMLTASAKNRAEWTEVHGVGISTSETAVSDISSDEKLITPAAVKSLIDTFLPDPVVFKQNSNLDMTERFFSKDLQYQVGDKCVKNVSENGYLYTHLYECTTDHVGDWDSDNFNDLGLVFTPPEDLNILDYLPAINAGNFKVISGNKIFIQCIGASTTSSTRTVQVQGMSSKGGAGLGILSDISTGSVTGIIYSPFGVSST